MQINPRTILDRGIIKYCETTKVQQVGVDLSIGQDFTVKHGESKNINFREMIKLPDNMYALFYVRSSWSRKGLFVSSGVYDSGYEGSIGCTVYNMSGQDHTFIEGDRIGQIICFLADAASSYNGQWKESVAGKL